MTGIEVSQSLRPLKFAYVIPPGDFRSLERVISLNSFLWGSRYNPILPFYQKIPNQLRDEAELKSAQQLFYGSLDFFQPDFLVRCGEIEESDLEGTPCEILQLDDISKNISEEHRPGFGVGVPELLQHYYKEEEKFVRKKPIENILPTYGRNHRCFLKSIFGDFPTELDPEVRENIIEAFDAKEQSISMIKYLGLLQGNSQNLHELSSINIKFDYAGDTLRERYVIYFLDPNSFIDIISYHNLKAAGYEVLPIARQIAKSDETKSHCLDFINKGSWVHPKKPHAMTHVTLQKSPNVEQAEVEEFYKFLAPPTFPALPEFERADWPRCIMRHFLPPFWSQFHRERGEVNCVSVTVDKKEDEVTLRDKNFAKVKALIPDFISDRSLQTAQPRYAIDIGMGRNYGSKDFEAGIVPFGSKEVARSYGMYDKRKWIIKRTGITYFSQYGSKIFFEVPKAHDVFLGWLKSRGWEAEISDAGKVAYQMLRHLDGPWRIMMIQSRKFVEYFSGQSFTNDKSVKAGEFIHKVSKDIYDELKIYWGTENFLKALLDSKIVQLGAKLQCDVCSRRSWHSIKELDQSVRCPQCLSDFEIPMHIPKKIEWAYKTVGPFAARGRAAGAYCVLLTAHFFNRDAMSTGHTTTILSFKAKKASREIEADLGLFYHESAFFNRTQETIFCECKTFNRFEKKDVEKMGDLANEFPGSMLVFATLNDDLDENEKALIATLAKSCNRYHERDRPMNPIMILTGNELFASDRPPFAWKDMGGKYEEFDDNSHIHSLLDICRATQKLYLDLAPWNNEWHKAWAERSKKLHKKS